MSGQAWLRAMLSWVISRNTRWFFEMWGMWGWHRLLRHLCLTAASQHGFKCSISWVRSPARNWLSTILFSAARCQSSLGGGGSSESSQGGRGDYPGQTHVSTLSTLSTTHLILLTGQNDTIRNPVSSLYQPVDRVTKSEQSDIRKVDTWLQRKYKTRHSYFNKIPNINNEDQRFPACMA